MSRKWLKGDCLGLVDEVYNAGDSVRAIFSVNVTADCFETLVVASVHAVSLRLFFEHDSLNQKP